MPLKSINLFFLFTGRANNSIFYYETGESAGNYLFPDFVPTFLKINNDSAEYQKALEICTKDERDCIYDYLITQNTKLAKNTKLVEEKIDFNAMIVGQYIFFWLFSNRYYTGRSEIHSFN